MSKKFDAFMKGLKYLCIKHDVDMWPDGRDLVLVVDLHPGKLPFCSNRDGFIDGTKGGNSA